MLENVRIGNPYYANSNYPAICFVILKALYHFMPSSQLEYFDTPREEAISMRDSMLGMMPFAVFNLICLGICCLCIRKQLEDRSGMAQNVAVGSFLLCGPVLFMIERGNILVLSLALLFVFLTFNHSGSRVVRMFSYIALSFSAAIKLYPAIFALLLLKEKRWKAFIFTAVVGLILLVAPFFLFGGIESFGDFIFGIIKSTNIEYGLGKNYSFVNFARIISLLLGLAPSVSSSLFSAAAILLGVTTFLCASERWQQYIALGLTCVWTPAFSFTYTLVFLIPGLIELLRCAKESSKFDILSLLLLIVVLSPSVSPAVATSLSTFPDAIHALYWGCVCGNVAILLLALGIIVRRIGIAINHISVKPIA